MAAPYDAVVVGAGPNGLAAAIVLARKGLSVLILERAATIGGGMRSAELTLPGFLHDVCSAIHPLALASPFFRQVPLEKYGLEWIHPEFPLVHPLLDGSAAVVERSLSATAAGLGPDGEAYGRLLEPLVRQADRLLPQILAPLHLPQDPWPLVQFGARGVRSARGLAQRYFRGDAARGMFAGMAAHSVLPLHRMLTAAVGLMFCMTAHAGGWPLPRGGSQSIAAAMEAYLRELGAHICTGQHVRCLKDVPPSKVILFDVTPRQLARIAGDIFPSRYRRRLERFRHGPGAFKIDWALDGPIPWTAPQCRRAGTVHVGGTFDAIAASENDAWSGKIPLRPFLLVAQQSVFDPTRAPPGKHTGWAYCHVPHGSTVDMTERIEAQMERFAPGFRDLILERHVMTPQDFEAYNPNYIGGDITGGVMDVRQLAGRPTFGRTPYATPVKNIFICSASTPPGAGVHGMCGLHAAQAAIRLGRFAGEPL